MGDFFFSRVVSVLMLFSLDEVLVSVGVIWATSLPKGKRVSDGLLTVFDLRQVAHHHVGHGNLDDISFPHDGELLLLFNSTLETSELLLLGPVIEGCDQNHTHHGQKDGGALDPAGVGFTLVLSAARHVPAHWRRQSRVRNQSAASTRRLWI